MENSDREFLRGLKIATDDLDFRPSKSPFRVIIKHIRANKEVWRDILAANETDACNEALSEFYEDYPNVLKKSYPIRVSVQRLADSAIPEIEQRMREKEARKPLLSEFYPEGRRYERRED
jgi:hypothetical protein